MSEEPTPNEPNADIPGGEDQPDVAAENAKLQERIKKMDETIKRNYDDAENWRKHQDSLKSQEEQLAERETAANRRADEAARELAIYKAASKHGLSEEHIELLDGADAEAIEAKAAKIAALIADSSKPRTPRPDPNQGRVDGRGARTAADEFAQWSEDNFQTL